jgi:hypothetical protein
MRTARHSQRGAASVEAAISMLIIIPAFMYSLFLDDLLRYAADLQEAVVSTPWDFSGQNFTQPGSRGLGSYRPKSEPYGGETLVQNQARLMFCDHESSGDTYSADADQDCNSQDHHVGKALSGHVCWLNKNAEQITCEPVQTNIGALGDPVYSAYKGRFGNTGGLYECYGKEVVENYLLPKSFLQEFAGDTKMTKKNWKAAGTDIHGNAEKGDNDTAYYLEQQRFAVLTDPWAVNEIPSADGNEKESQLDLAVAPGTKSGPLYDRVNLVYQRNLLYAPMAGSVGNFMMTAGQKLLSPGALALGDSPLTPNVSLTKAGTRPPEQSIRQDKSTASYYSTPWQDWNSDPYKATNSARGKYYMGCNAANGSGC